VSASPFPPLSGEEKGRKRGRYIRCNTLGLTSVGRFVQLLRAMSLKGETVNEQVVSERMPETAHEMMIVPEEQLQMAAWTVVGEAIDGNGVAVIEVWTSYQEMLASAEANKQLALKFSARQASYNALAERIKGAIKKAMEDRGVTEVKTPAGPLRILANGGNPSVVVTGEVPDEYAKVKREPDKRKIAEALKEGAILDFACFDERGTHLELDL
jgi:hypothetical protein